MSRPILIVGLTDAGPAGLPIGFLERIRRAALLVGGARHLAWFPEAPAERLTVTANIDAVVARLRDALDEPGEAVVLASGDPLWFGIGATLRRHVAPTDLDVRPAPSAAQLAFAALGEPWAGAALLSAHARPVEEVVRACPAAGRAAILTDPVHTPATIARALLAAGHSATRPVAVAENLGGPGQRLWRGTLAAAARREAGPLNVLVLLPPSGLNDPEPVELRSHTVGHSQDEEPHMMNNRSLVTRSPVLDMPLGGQATPGDPPLADDAFVHNAGLITKREIRVLALAALRPAGGVVWDIGAGCGSVGLEAALMGASEVWAVEKNASGCALISANAARLEVGPHFHLTHGHAPEACIDWPTPDAIFIGGSGGALSRLLRAGWIRLRAGGRLVATFATIENLAEITATLRALGIPAEITQINIARARPILEMTRFEALNPVWLVSAIKTGGADRGGGIAGREPEEGCRR